MFGSQEQEPKMTQEEIDECYMKTIDVGDQIYFNTLLNEVKLNFGVVKSELAKDLIHVNNRYIQVSQHMKIHTEIRVAALQTGFEEKKAINQVKEIIKVLNSPQLSMINAFEVSNNLANQIAQKLTILRRDFCAAAQRAEEQKNCLSRAR